MRGRFRAGRGASGKSRALRGHAWLLLKVGSGCTSSHACLKSLVLANLIHAFLLSDASDIAASGIALSASSVCVCLGDWTGIADMADFRGMAWYEGRTLS